MMINNKAKAIESYLDSILPDARCELIYHKDYELLIAVVLSAQTTDKSVNLVTPKLWDRYKSIDELANADIKEVEDIIKSKGLSQISDTSVLKDIINNVLNSNPQAIEDYKNGLDRSIKFLMGQIMKETKGQANPKLANELLLEELKNRS